MTAGHIFSFSTGKRAVIYHEVHGDCRLRNLLEWNSNRIAISSTDRITDMQISDTRNGNDRTNLCLFHIDLLQSLELIELRDTYILSLVRIMMVDNDCILVQLDAAVGYFSNTDTTDIIIVINGRNKNLCVGIRITCRSRNVFEDGIEKRSHILLLIAELLDGISIFC